MTLTLQQDRSEHKVWADTFDGPIHCISTDDLGRVLAIGHGREVTLLNQKTLCTFHRARVICVLMTEADPAHWENIRTLPSPPEFTTGLPTPSPRGLHFMKDGNLIAGYLDHGIV